MIASARRPSRPWMWPWLVLPIGVGELVGAPRGGATSFPFHERTRRCSRYGWSQAQPGATRRALRSATPTLASATFCGRIANSSAEDSVRAPWRRTTQRSRRVGLHGRGTAQGSVRAGRTCTTHREAMEPHNPALAVGRGPPDPLHHHPSQRTPMTSHSAGRWSPLPQPMDAARSRLTPCDEHCGRRLSHGPPADSTVDMRRSKAAPIISTTAVAGVLTLLASALPAAAQPAVPDTAPPQPTPANQAPANTTAANPTATNLQPREQTSTTQVDAPVPEVDWQDCEGEDVQQFDCATVQVPSDYDNPHGATTSIAMTRLPASNPEEKVGSLFLNFGGPGGPGVQNLHALGGSLFTDEVRAHFDVVAFDPRGVALSDPVTCFRDAETEQNFFAGMPAFPVGQKEELRTIAKTAALGVSCTVVSGDRISTSSTANVARDMDLLRQAVGDEQLNYVGYSYGTILGATYGELFPDRIRTMVLDGTVDPDAWVGEGDERSLGRRMGQAVATDETYHEFLRLCGEAGPQDCALAGLGDPEQVVEDLFDQLKENPAEVPMPDGSTTEIGYDDAVYLVFQSMYSPTQWSDLAATLAALVEPEQQNRAFSTQSTGADSIRDFLRKIGFLEDYASVGGALASMCMDTHNPGTLADYPAQAAAAEEEAPHFGPARAWVGSQCETVGGSDSAAYTGPWAQSSDAPVLATGTRYDPATPYEFTEPYAEKWPNASMLTVEDYKHTTMMTPSSCANAAIEDYLIDREATDGATCTQDVAPFTPAAEQSQPELVPAALG